MAIGFEAASIVDELTVLSATFFEHVAGMAKAIPVLIGVVMPLAIYTHKKCAVARDLADDRYRFLRP